jgi:transposase
VGVASFNKDSGKYSVKRYIQGGRKPIRNHLYMAAVVGTRWNCLLAEFYQRLRLAGKPAKVAFTAVFRKLICLVNSIAK